MTVSLLHYHANLSIREYNIVQQSTLQGSYATEKANSVYALPLFLVCWNDYVIILDTHEISHLSRSVMATASCCLCSSAET